MQVTNAPGVLKKIVLYALIWSSTTAFAQFARIQDKDGFVNIRSKPSINSPVVGKAPEGYIFWCFEREGDWYPITYGKKAQAVSGFIHHSRVTFIEEFPVIPLKATSANKILFQNTDFGVEIIIRKFIEKEHSIQRNQKDNPSYISSIDNRPFWGQAGEMPTMEYHTIAVTVAGKPLVLPKKEIADLFDPSFHHTSVNYDKASHTLYITSSNSDGAGAYEVLWAIKDGKYAGRTVDVAF